jgi:hypothetical protein
MGRAEKTEDNRGQIISRFETLRDEFKKKHPGATRSLLRLTKGWRLRCQEPICYLVPDTFVTPAGTP